MKTQYAGRQPGIVMKALNLDRYAAEELEAMASHPRARLRRLLEGEHEA